MGTAKKVIMRATNMNDYVAILVGLGITFIVQSSSVTTSTLTPLCGVGVLPVHKMFPMTLGANIGTTFTSMLAAIAVMKPDSLQIAFVHLLFNIFGILIWFPVPFMRRIPIKAACLLGFYASYWRLVPLIYILVMFCGFAWCGPGHLFALWSQHCRRHRRHAAGPWRRGRLHCLVVDGRLLQGRLQRAARGARRRDCCGDGREAAGRGGDLRRRRRGCRVGGRLAKFCVICSLPCSRVLTAAFQSALHPKSVFRDPGVRC